MNPNLELQRILSCAFRIEEWSLLSEDRNFLRMAREIETFDDLKRVIDLGRKQLNLVDLDFSPEIELRKRAASEALQEEAEIKKDSRPLSSCEVPSETRLRWEEETPKAQPR